MRVLVDVSKVEASEWRVSICTEGKGAAATTERSMLRLGGKNGLAVPLPPLHYADALPATAIHRPLCTATDPGLALQVLARLSGRQGQSGEAEAFGRYLFACLLGEETWGELVRRAEPTEPIELSLGWSDKESDLFKLPWEMMHGPSSFLGTLANRRVAVTRRVPNADIAPGRISIRPRVLFVVGASLEDPAIQAGTEWLGLLRRLSARGVALVSHVLVEATPQQVRDAVEAFQPSIVHFICHGSINDAGAGQIYLMSEERESVEEPRTAAQISALLGEGETRPPIVVLNACSTGGGAATSKALLGTPLAAELVGAGVPIVVAHTGRVSDRACRLFTRRFYEALLEGEDLAQATAEGRRTARALGGDPTQGIDWAFPTLFLAQGVPPAAMLVGLEDVVATARRAAGYRTLTNPPAFCGRIECVSAFDSLLRDRSMQPKRVLAYEVVEREQAFTSPRYGKTRLLEELASRAVQEGVEPCLVTFSAGDSRPKNACEIGMAVVRAIMRTRHQVGLPPMPEAGFQTLRVKQHYEGATGADLGVVVQAEIDLQSLPWKLTGHVIGAALRQDLGALAAALSSAAVLPALLVSRLVVLIDEVNAFGDGARELLDEMLTPHGFGTMAAPVPVVLAYTGSRVAGEGATAAQALTSFFETGRAFVHRVPLHAFRSPVEDRLAYRQFLLNLEPPLVLSDLESDGARIESFFKLLHSKVRGVPSRLENVPLNGEVFAVIEASQEYHVLSPALDQDALAEVRK